jgi:GntR family transcriptional regulator
MYRVSGQPQPRRVSRASKLPLYHQIELDVRQQIESGEWKPGDQIPTEVELGTIYGTSRVTIRQAISNLVAAGRLVREPGRGTFVCEPAVTAGPRGLTSFTEEMRGLGFRATSQLLDLRLEPAGDEIAPLLKIDPDDAVVTVRRLRLGDGRPIGLQTAHLPALRFPELERASLAEGSLYAYLESHFAVVPAEAEETFFAAPIIGDNARLLQVSDGACGLRVERLTFEEHGPFEYVTSIMRGDRYRVRLGLRPVT